MKLTAGSLTRTIKYVYSYLYGRWTNTARVCKYSILVSSDFMRPKCRAADAIISAAAKKLQWFSNLAWIFYGLEITAKKTYLRTFEWFSPSTSLMIWKKEPTQRKTTFGSIHPLVMSRALCDAGLFVDDESLKADPRVTEDYQTMIGNSDVNGNRWVR